MCANRPTRWRQALRAFTCIALAAFGHASRASAESSPRLAVAATWNAPASCPTQAEVLTQIEELVSESSLTSDTTSLVARATVIERLGRYQLEMHIDAAGASKSKTIDAERCDALAQAYAVIVAFTLDPSAGTHQSAPPVVAGATPSPAPAESPPSPVEAPVRSPMPDLAMGPLAALGIGFLPSPALGFGARAALGALPRWEISGTYWLPRDATASPISAASPGAGGSVSLASAALSACVPLPLRAMPIDACTGLDLGRMIADSVAVPVHSSGASWWLAPTAAIAAHLPLSRTVAIRVRLAAGVPLFRPRFVLENVGVSGFADAYRPAPVFGIFAIEPELRFFSTDEDHGGHFPR